MAPRAFIRDDDSLRTRETERPHALPAEIVAYEIPESLIAHQLEWIDMPLLRHAIRILAVSYQEGTG